MADYRTPRFDLVSLDVADVVFGYPERVEFQENEKANFLKLESAIFSGSGSGSAGVWEQLTGSSSGIVRLISPFSGAMVVGEDADSRDNPSAFIIFRNEGLPNNPMFGLGNPYVAGIGKEAWGVWYKDDTQSQWSIIISGEKTGTYASILDGVRRSSIESFIQNNDFKPWMRIEASSQATNYGPGGAYIAPLSASRYNNVVTARSRAEHKFGVGTPLWKVGGPGDDSEFGPDSSDTVPSFYVSEVVDSTTFKFVHSGSNVTGSFAMYLSSETDVAAGRDERFTFAVRVSGSSVTRFKSTGISMPGGLSVLAEEENLPLGAQGVAAVHVKSGTLHVLEGKTFYNQGLYRSTVWWNGGGETQSTQENFFVGGTGVRTTTIRKIDGVDGMVFRIKNKSSDALQILSQDNTDTFDGRVDQWVQGWGAVQLISNASDGNWEVMYCQPPPTGSGSF